MLDGKSRKPSLDVSGIKFSPMVELSEDEIVNRMDDMLRAGIRKVLDANGNVGFLTSGGIDSGVVTAIGAELSGKPIRTFCLVYADDLGSEGKRTDREYAKMVSEIYKTKHHELQLSIDEFPKELPAIIKYFGEPFSGYVSEYFVAKMVKPYVDTVLTGDWADELFGSYRTHRLATQYPEANTWDLRYSHVVFDDEEKQWLYNAWICGLTNRYSTLKHLENYSKNLSATDSFNRMLESEFRSLFVDQTYLSIDVLSKAQGLRVIGGYAFPNFVDFVTKISKDWKMKDGETKYILKKLALRYLPKEIVYRSKEGFITPTLQLVLGLEGYVRDALIIDNLLKHNLFNIDYILELIDEFYKKPTDGQSYKIWNLVCFQVWYNLYIGDPE